MMKYQDSAIDRDYVLLPFTCVGMHLFVMNPMYSKCLTRMYSKTRNLSEGEHQVAGGVVRGLYNQGECVLVILHEGRSI